MIWGRRGGIYIAAAVSRGRSGRGGRCVHRADGRTGADEALTRRSSGRADGAEGARTVGRMGAERVQRVEHKGGRGPRGANTRTRPNTHKRAYGRTGGLGGRRRKSCGRADWADGQTG